MNKARQRTHDAISRLAALYEYGELLASTDPATLLHQAADEIEQARAARQAPGVGGTDGK